MNKSVLSKIDVCLVSNALVLFRSVPHAFLLFFLSFFLFVLEHMNARLLVQVLGIDRATMAFCYRLFSFSRERVQWASGTKKTQSLKRVPVQFPRAAGYLFSRI